MDARTRDGTFGRAAAARIVVVAMLTLAACAFTTTHPDPAPAATPVQGFASADAAMRARIRADHLDGGALVVRRATQTLHHETFGSWTPRSVVPIASASKWLTSATLMTFVDEGRLRLDDPVSAYLPRFDGAKQAITVRMLLSHTHGLVSPGCEGDPTTTLTACAREVGDGPAPAWRPGTEFHYGGTGFVVAGAIVEHVSGTSFEQAFETRVAKPTGMTTTAFDGSISARGRHRKASTRNPAPAASAVSSTADYTRFVAMLAAGGMAGQHRVLSEAAVAEIERDQVAGIDTSDDDAVHTTGIPTYGLGVWRDEVSSTDAIRVVSGSGALGFYPWIDRVHGTYGIVAVDDPSGSEHAVPLSQRIARQCWTAAAASGT